MTFDEYQQRAITTIIHKDDRFHELMEKVLGLADESGEVQAIFKKWIRDQDADFEQLDRDNVKKELGDVLWYVAGLAHDLGISFEDLASSNLAKLASRAERGVIGGSGDNR